MNGTRQQTCGCNVHSTSIALVTLLTMGSSMQKKFVAKWIVQTDQTFDKTKLEDFYAICGSIQASRGKVKIKRGELDSKLDKTVSLSKGQA